jgi:lambda repressor-like predicted transcriptional regulator
MGRLVYFQKMLAPQQKEATMETVALKTTTREPWNKGKLVGQKTSFKLKEIWAIRCRELALLNLATDATLRAVSIM